MVIDSSIEDIIKRAQQRLQQRIMVLKKWRHSLRSLPPLPNERWVGTKLVERFPLPRISEESKIAAVDGGILVEELRGFDVLISRAIVVTYTGVGKRVKVNYFPSFDPEPSFQVKESFDSRVDFSQYSTLFRLLQEYGVSHQKIMQDNPDVLFIDGSVSPLLSDLVLPSDNPELVSLLEQVKQVYRDLVQAAEERGTLLLGIVKDSRSRELTKHLSLASKSWGSSPGPIENMLDAEFSDGILDEGERISWFRSSLPLSLKLRREIWVTYAKPIVMDDPVRLEVLCGTFPEFEQRLNLALQAFYVLCQHGLPLALPTNLQEADRQVKLKRHISQEFIEELSVHFGIPLERLKKRRTFDSSFLNFT